MGKGEGKSAMPRLPTVRRERGLLRLSRAAILCAAAFVCLPAICAATPSRDSKPADPDPKRPSRSVVYSYPWIGTTPKGGLASAASPGIWDGDLVNYVSSHWLSASTGFVTPDIGGKDSVTSRWNYLVFVDGMDTSSVPPVLSTHYFWRQEVTRVKIFDQLYEQTLGSVSGGGSENEGARYTVRWALQEEGANCFSIVEMRIEPGKLSHDKRSVISPRIASLDSVAFDRRPVDKVPSSIDVPKENMRLGPILGTRSDKLVDELEKYRAGRQFVVEMYRLRHHMYNRARVDGNASYLNIVTMGSIQRMAIDGVPKRLREAASKALLDLVYERVKRSSRGNVFTESDTEGEKYPELRIAIVGTGKYQLKGTRYR